MRVDFTNQTSFTVAAVDLPTNFEPGNGMVQVFQDMGSNKFRHLVAPSTYNASTGAMSFDLGSTAKSGFVVFYSFAGDEGTATEQATNVSHAITGVDISGLNLTASTSTSIKVNVSGVSASDYEKHMSFTNKAVIRFWDASSFYMPLTSGIGISESNTYPYITATWESDYSAVTYTWTNPSSAPTLGEYGSNGYSRVDLYIGTPSGTTSSAYVNVFMQMHIDSTDITNLKTDSGFGKTLSDNSSSLPVYDYIAASGGVGDYAYNSSLGPAWYFDISDWVYTTDYQNGTYQYASSQWQGGLQALIRNGAVAFTHNGAAKYWAPSSTYIDSSHHLYSELTANSASLQSGNHQFYALSKTGAFATSQKGFALYRSSGSAFPQPDANTDITIYGAIHEDNGSSSFGAYAGMPEDSQTDVKIVISMSDRTDSNMSIKFYRNSATSAGNVSWVEVDRLYLGGHDVS
jgi:hypothetical protein